MKKLLCLFTALLIFICSACAMQRKDFFKFVQCCFSDFSLVQYWDYRGALNQSETEKDRENAFKVLYTVYIDYYKDILQHYIETENEEASFDYEYVKKYKDEYEKYGLGFNIKEGMWEIEPDYTMLMETSEIPKIWLEWLKLQQKYVVKERNTCIKLYKKGMGCEGIMLTIPEIERAIIDLGKVEQKSEVIASIKSQNFDYIPYTSRELIDTYLMGNDLYPIFEWYEYDTKKLKNDSKKSFEHFIKHHKDSKYWNIVNEYYKKLEKNNFIYSPYINGWLIDELESMK